MRSSDLRPWLSSAVGQLVVEQLARAHGRELALDRPVKGLLGAATSELSTGETIELCLFVPPTCVGVPSCALIDR